MLIAFGMQKGGTGKTSSVQNFAAGLTRQGKKVLTIDLDAQTNLTFSTGIDPGSAAVTIIDVLEKKTAPADAVIHTEEYDIIPGDYRLSGADVQFTATGREYLLSDALENIRNDYDYVLLDCPPQLGLMTVNALAVADSVIIPLTATVYSLQGLGQLHQTIATVKRYCNRNLSINGLLITRFRPTNTQKQTVEAIKQTAKTLHTKVYDAIIREGTSIPEAQIQRASLFKIAPRANVTADYKQFIDEFLKGESDNGK